MNITDKLENIFGEDFIVRFNQDELDKYIEEGLTEYARRCGSFLVDYELECADNGLVSLPKNVICLIPSAFNVSSIFWTSPGQKE